MRRGLLLVAVSLLLILHTRAVADPQTLALLDQFEAVQLGLHAEAPVITPSGGRTSAAAGHSTA